MKEPVFYTPGGSVALQHAKAILEQKGFRFLQKPSCTATHLLLPVPSFASDSTLKCGGKLEELLPSLSPDVTVIGGLLRHPVLDNYKKIDLLEDPEYLAENARITAYCALKHAMNHLPVILWQCPVLVIGWGRIGKCLAQLLSNLGASVTVGARKETDRAMLRALGYDALDTDSLGNSLARFRLIFNTVPKMLLSKDSMSNCQSDCAKFELASLPGMDAPDVIPVKGLPGKDAPESSGQLIARTALRLLI